MARTTKTVQKIKQQRYDGFTAMFKEVSEKHNLKEDAVIEVFKKAVRIVFAKDNGGDDVNVNVILNEDALDFEAQLLKTVVEHDEDISDDALEIELAEAKKIDNDAVVGGTVVVKSLLLEKFNVRDSGRVAQNFRSQLIDIEKEQLFNLFKDKIGELVKGKVEKNEKYTYINLLGITNVMFNERGREAIPGEVLRNGQELNFIIKEVTSGAKGALINISRSDENFVKRLMEREIHEIYDGTIVIHKIVREAGERVKVAVESLDPNVDPVGSCIGPNASRIQKITAELGPDGRKEKIDIIPWSKNPGLLIFESFRPAVPLGLTFDTETKTTNVVFPEEEKGKAFGNKGANIRLAAALTNYKITILDENEAREKGINYLTKADIEYEARIAEQEKTRERILRELARSEELASQMGSQKQLLEDEVNNINVEELQLKDLEVHEVEEVVAPVEEIKQVKTTISLADLEAGLAKEKAEAPKEKQPWKKEERRPRPVKKEEKVEIIEPVISGPKMDIYTEEEIKELEKINLEVEDDDIDYDEFDEYYQE